MDPINSKGQITSQIIAQLAVPQKGWIHRVPFEYQIITI